MIVPPYRGSCRNKKIISCCAFWSESSCSRVKEKNIMCDQKRRGTIPALAQLPLSSRAAPYHGPHELSSQPSQSRLRIVKASRVYIISILTSHAIYSDREIYRGKLWYRHFSLFGLDQIYFSLLPALQCHPSFLLFWWQEGLQQWN